MPGLERPIETRPGERIQVTIYIDKTLCEIYLNSQVVLSARMYDHPEGGEWGVFSSGGTSISRRLSSAQVDRGDD